MIAILLLIHSLLGLFQWAIILSVVMSWLIVFNVVNTHNRFVYFIYDALKRVTEPALNRIRRFMPNLGAIDISPIVLLLLIVFLRNFIRFDLITWLG